MKTVYEIVKYGMFRHWRRSGGKTRRNVWSGRPWQSVFLAWLAVFSSHAHGGDALPSDAPAGLLQGGFTLPNTGLTLGGYATASAATLPHDSTRLALDNTSLFLWWDGGGRWQFFSELDYQNLLRNHAINDSEGDRYLALERFYADYAFSETATLRIGKFLTPIGRWNVIHATPLVWTTSRPLITTNVFPGNVTGLMVSGTAPMGSTGFDYSVYASRNSELRPNPAQDTFRESVGGRIVLPLPCEVRLGLSFSSFDQKSHQGENKRLLGMDFFWSRDRYELSGEGVYRFSDNGRDWDERGAFVQGVAPLGEKLYAVGRFESFRQALQPKATKLWVAGVNYHYTSAVIFKAEWVVGSDNHIDAPTGFMTSLSLLF
jgi:hypothetical protein